MTASGEKTPAKGSWLSTIPRLITVAKIIKRECLKAGSGKSFGLHQYNEIGYLEDSVGDGHDGEGDGEAKTNALALAIGGQNQWVSTSCGW